MSNDSDVRPYPQTYHGRWMSEEYEPGLVSIIIPTYDRAHMVTEAMDSVWAQTYRPIELMVVGHVPKGPRERSLEGSSCKE